MLFYFFLSEANFFQKTGNICIDKFCSFWLLFLVFYIQRGRIHDYKWIRKIRLCFFKILSKINLRLLRHEYCNNNVLFSKITKKKIRFPVEANFNAFLKTSNNFIWIHPRDRRWARAAFLSLRHRDGLHFLNLRHRGVFLAKIFALSH